MPKPTIEKVYQDLERTSKKQSALHKKIKEDIEFALGKQWRDEDKLELEKAGVLPLTINQIKPQIKIVTGIERQSRSDYVGHPEGDEDELGGEIITKLLKNVTKQSLLDKKLSSVFKEGIMGGLCFIEPYIDYTYDLINGEMKFRKVSADRVFYDEGEEYDLSDRPCIIKVTTGINKDDLLEMFPDSEEKIDQVNFKNINFGNFKEVFEKIQTRDYEFDEDHSVASNDNDRNEGYDLVEYYYKAPKTIFFLGDRKTGEVKEYDKRADAEQELENINLRLLQEGQPVNEERFVIIKKRVPEIRLKQVVGNVELSDDTCWSYPKWRKYPIVPFFAEVMDIELEDKTLLVQGLTRSLKDLQLELNKSRTLELRHLNSTANSGWMFPEGMLDQRTLDAFKRFGSTPGFAGEYNKDEAGGVVSPETFRIRPAPMPQGHMALSAQRMEEIKQTSGINPDLLANDSQSQSGRAILLKQRQGLVMLQEALDNYSETKKILGRFILSQLGEIFTVERVAKVLGSKYIESNFSRPVINEDTGEIELDEKDKPVEKVNPEEFKLVISSLINNDDVGKYDVSIGEGAYSETIKFTNYLTLMDMVDKGIPIPPDVIIQESLLTEDQKKKIIRAITAQKDSSNNGRE